MSEARGDIVAFTDDDTIVDAGWLEGIRVGFGRADDVACVTGLVPAAELTTVEQEIFEGVCGWSSNLVSEVYRLRDREWRGSLFPLSAGRFGTGANFALDRHVLDDVGGFDEALGAGTRAKGGEDLDAFVQVLLTGQALAYEPSAIVWHFHRRERSELRSQMFGYGAGLAAYLTKQLLDRRTRRQLIVGAAHGAAAFFRARQSGPEAHLTADLVAAEVSGLLWGPFAYALGRFGK
jgi:GT2 family glycosyltransferase